MTQESHDHNFKNLLLDFPTQALEWILPDTLDQFGSIKDIIFIRQEPKKYKLSDSHLALDMPILFKFEKQQVLLWLLEFQEDKNKFSIYKLLHYTADMKEAFPDALLIPTVLFTDRKKWRKDVDNKVNSSFNNRTFLHFEYIKIKLFDYNAGDYYNSNNPLVRILLPKMNYTPGERGRVIREAYKGLYQLTNPALFEKYIDFIDVYAEIDENEREHLYHELIEHKETVMLAQYIKDKGIQQGIHQGINQGIHQGIHQGEMGLICRQFSKKFHIAPEMLAAQLKNLKPNAVTELGERIFEWESFEQIKEWIKSRKTEQ